ncbi:RidA family protein [Herbaspirillum sp. RTI4]|uniref:RidA family protein n=1 Tax=Herbaspirillum sp. RTI4 TaxID=3048640 RepID=UPI002AB35EB2|nr:RidA family protein [Herbaspirillum sp. RTI4]MDY7579341.1 RidA family protein [Herbaspirillum sp. RTI4]MEA9980255.1 RidA family protein [Herbaspirillum sp. RTI4]
MTLTRLHVGARLSDAAIHQGVVYLAGQVPDDLSQGIDGQTREVLAHVERLLIEAGSGKDRILSCQIFLANIKDFAGMNAVWDGWVVPGHTPPRATVESKLARPEVLVEVVVVAAQK